MIKPVCCLRDLKLYNSMQGNVFWVLALILSVSCGQQHKEDVVSRESTFDKEKYLVRYLKQEVNNTNCKPAIDATWTIIIQAANCGSCDVRTLRMLEKVLEINDDGYIVFTSKLSGAEKIDSTISHSCVYYDEGNYSKYGLFHKENYFFLMEDSAIKHWAYLTDENADSISTWLRASKHN